MNRTRIDITAEILQIARNGAIKTRIVYGANINFFLLHQYLERLKECQLITNNGKTVKTTERGLQFLEMYNRLKAMIYCIK